MAAGRFLATTAPATALGAAVLQDEEDDTGHSVSTVDSSSSYSSVSSSSVSSSSSSFSHSRSRTGASAAGGAEGKEEKEEPVVVRRCPCECGTTAGPFLERRRLRVGVADYSCGLCGKNFKRSSTNGHDHMLNKHGLRDACVWNVFTGKCKHRKRRNQRRQQLVNPPLPLQHIPPALPVNFFSAGELDMQWAAGVMDWYSADGTASCN